MPRPERSFRCSALILQRRDFGEADRLLTLLTDTHGRLNAIAKGARKPNNTKTGHVELYTRTEMLIHKGRELDIISQAEMTAPYLPLREDLQRGAFAAYVAELVLRFTADSDSESPSLFALVDSTLARLCEPDADLRWAVRYFEVHLLALVGFKPQLQRCVVSHQLIQPQDQYFSYEYGGAVAPDAAPYAGALVPISVTALKMLRHMQRSAYEAVQHVSVPQSVHSELERVMLGYITHLLERRLQSVDFIRRVRDS